jgi:hypothetical protein
MALATRLTVHGYGDHQADPANPKPLIQVLYHTEHGDVHDLCFHPDDAGAIIGAIMAASASALVGPAVKACIHVALRQPEPDA